MISKAVIFSSDGEAIYNETTLDFIVTTRIGNKEIFLSLREK